MPYTVTLDEDHKIVCVQVSGMSTIEELVAGREESFRLCEEKGWSLLLIDLTELDTSSLSTVVCFSFGKEIAMALPKMRLAHVLPRETKSRSDVKFTNTVAWNRGKMLKDFNSVEEARQWLLDGAG